jgi:hypothetical protein
MNIGDIVDIEFWDHAEDASDAMRFRLTGEVLAKTSVAVIIGTWRYACPIDRERDDNIVENENRFAIVKSAIIQCRVMQPVIEEIKDGTLF